MEISMRNKNIKAFSSQTESNKLNKHLYYCILMVSLYLTFGQTIKCKNYFSKIMFSLHISKSSQADGCGYRHI